MTLPAGVIKSSDNHVTFNHWVTGSESCAWLTIIRGHCDGSVFRTSPVTMTFFLGHVIIPKGQVITVVWSSDYSDVGCLVSNISRSKSWKT